MGIKPANLNRGRTIKMYCPECDEDLRIIVKYSDTDRGAKYAACKKCDFAVRYRKGDYIKFRPKG